MKDVYVTKPLDASNLTMDSREGKLVVYTSRERYLTPDGLNHQSNIPLHIQMEDMSNLYAGGQWPYNHVSHSFATYVKFDGERIVYLDHGDGYPRSIFLQVDDSGRIRKSIDILSFPGEIGDNYTGAKVGGLEVSKDHYLVVGSYLQPSGTRSQLFLSSVPKNAETSDEINVTYLTDPKGHSVAETHLVKLNDDRFVIVWSDKRSKSNVNYVVIDGSGQLKSKPKRLEGIASPGNMEPLVLNGKIIWYYQEHIYNKDDIAEFYELEIQ